MIQEERQSARDALLLASSELLAGLVPGPLTGIRLVEVAGVKRHRLTHDNPDINADFQRRARELNRSKPEVDQLRANLAREKEAGRRVAQERDELRKQLNAYATSLLALAEDRDRLLRILGERENVTALRRPT